MHAEGDGRVGQVKSYLAGNPAISLALNDNLIIGRNEGGVDYGATYGRTSDVVMLDDCNFHESVQLDRFEKERTLELVPPDGEFAVMNYRCDLPHLHTLTRTAQRKRCKYTFCG